MNRDKYLKLSQQQAEANAATPRSYGPRPPKAKPPPAATASPLWRQTLHPRRRRSRSLPPPRSLRPVGDSEGLVLQRIAAAQWRLDRAFALETELRLSKGQNDPFPPDPHEPDDLLARAFMQDGKGPDNFTRLFRYETARRPGSPHALEPPPRNRQIRP